MCSANCIECTVQCWMWSAVQCSAVFREWNSLNLSPSCLGSLTKPRLPDATAAVWVNHPTSLHSLAKSPNLHTVWPNHATSPHGLAKSPNLRIYIGTWKLLRMQANTFSLLLSMASLVYRAWLSSYFICCSLALWGLQTLVQVYLVSFNNASKRIVLVPQTSL